MHVLREISRVEEAAQAELAIMYQVIYRVDAPRV